ncbi:SapC family protein [Sphingomonas sp. PB2P12]|uniref:SapC family protein n=1 Tax=Sphingomonas sandaracina TaxID=3096157 RepID=UPI002FCB0BE1
MTNIVLLNNIDHGDLVIATGHGPEFGDAVNQVLVFPTEWQDVQREYPILFRRAENGQYQSVALVGLDRDENLFLAGGEWRARYVPALHSRGPFSIGVQRSEDGGEDEPMIHIDLDHPRVAKGAGQGTGQGTGQGKGQPVFLTHGGNSPYLNAIADVLRRIHAGVLANEPVFDAFEAEGLIEPVAVEIMLDETTKYTLDDLYTISADRLAALDGAALHRLQSRGYLEAAFWAIASLGTVPHLIERKTDRLSGR